MVGETSVGAGRSEDVVQQFTELVELWLAEHPARTQCLTPAMIHFVTAKLLIWKSKNNAAKSTWPGEGASRLAGALLVLLANESSPDDNDETGNILGFVLEEIVYALQEVIHRAGISCEDLRATALEMDPDGAAAGLTMSEDFAAALYAEPGGVGGDSASAVLALFYCKGQKLGPVAESAAHLHRLATPELFAPAVPRMMRQRLASRFMRVRLLLCILVSFWFLAADYLPGLSARYNGLRMPPPIAVYLSVLLIGNLIIAASFPTHLNSQEGRLFVLPVSLVCAISCVNTCLVSYFRSDNTALHVNAACRWAHALLCISVILQYFAIWVICLRGRLTWRLLRFFYAVEGLLFLSCNCALWLLGDPPVYLPRRTSWRISMFRATAVPLLAASLSPANRHAIATLFNRFGWNHVTLALSSLRRVRFADPEEDGGLAFQEHESSCSSHAPPETTANVGTKLRPSQHSMETQATEPSAALPPSSPHPASQIAKEHAE